MADQDHLAKVLQGTDVWNAWRSEHPEVLPDLKGVVLNDAYLAGINLSHADLTGADIRSSDLSQADFSRAILYRANLWDSVCYGANLRATVLNEADLTRAILQKAELLNANMVRVTLNQADLRNANLRSVNLAWAEINQANLRHADVSYADISEASLNLADLSGTTLIEVNFDLANFYRARIHDVDLRGARLTHAKFIETEIRDVKMDNVMMGGTVLADVDLSGVTGLETVRHSGPSEISVSTLYRSQGRISEKFLLDCGVPESFIVQIPALVAAVQPIQFNSCFISYSTKDEEFASRLHSRMRAAGLRVWFAPEDIKGGEKLYEQIDRAIQVHDRLLLVLSRSSMESEWVMTEIRRARKAEVKEGRRKLFPISLVNYEAIKDWECFDADHGKDLAVEVREYYIPDFSNWKRHDDFEREFARLYQSLKVSA